MKSEKVSKTLKERQTERERKQIDGKTFLKNSVKEKEKSWESERETERKEVEKSWESEREMERKEVEKTKRKENRRKKKEKRLQPRERRRNRVSNRETQLQSYKRRDWGTDRKAAQEAMKKRHPNRQRKLQGGTGSYRERDTHRKIPETERPRKTPQQLQKPVLTTCFWGVQLMRPWVGPSFCSGWEWPMWVCNNRIPLMKKLQLINGIC